MTVVEAKCQALGIPVAKESVTRYPLRRPVEEYELGKLAIFLASEESSGITGQTVVCHCDHHI